MDGRTDGPTDRQMDKPSYRDAMMQLPGDRPELSKCMMQLLINYQSKLVGDGLVLKRIAERLLIQKEIAPKC